MTIKDVDSFEEVKVYECSSCEGLGCYDVGDCEEGVVETCKACDGTGKEQLL